MCDLIAKMKDDREEHTKHHKIVLWLFDKLPRPTPEKPPFHMALCLVRGVSGYVEQTYGNLLR